jgi:thymidylate synthase (FAD)
LQVICPPSIGIVPGEYTLSESDATFHELFKKTANLHPQQRGWIINRELAYSEYISLLAEGIPPEDARFSLPIATKTELAATFNLRMWRHLFRERAFNKHAQWEIRDTFTGIYEDLVERLPAVFGDLK